MTEETATLIFKRWPRWVYMLRRFDIIIDGQKVGSVANGREEIICVTPGQHKAELRASWIIKSKSQTLQIKPNETWVLECGCPLSVWQFMLPSVIFIMLGLQGIIKTLGFLPLMLYLLFTILFALIGMIYYISLFIGRGKFVSLKEPQLLSSESTQAAP